MRVNTLGKEQELIIFLYTTNGEFYQTTSQSNDKAFNFSKFKTFLLLIRNILNVHHSASYVFAFIEMSLLKGLDVF